MIYYKRIVDVKLLEWKDSERRKPLLIRGARQVGKSSAVRELGRSFKYFIEINLEKQPALKNLFTEDIDVKGTCEKLAATFGVRLLPVKRCFSSTRFRFARRRLCLFVISRKTSRNYM